MAADLACDKFWVNKNLFHDAEKKYYENLAKLQRNGQNNVGIGGREEKCRNVKKSNRETCELHLLEAQNVKNEGFPIDSDSKKKKCHIENAERKDALNCQINYSEKRGRQKEVKENKCKNEKCKNTKEDNLLGGVGMARLNQETFPKTSLAGEVAKARQHIKSSLECMNQSINGAGGMTNARLAALLEKMEKCMEDLTKRVEALEVKCASCPAPGAPAKVQAPPAKAPSKNAKDDDDDDVDLFGSDSEEEDEEAKKIREQRLAEYAAKKSKKPALVAKSNIILDIKPWDDETDLKEMEKAVRAIEMDGLVWGASKFMPVAFKIFKLQISCVIEDDKVSVDLLTETLEEITDYIQSVDIAAFNKV